MKKVNEFPKYIRDYYGTQGAFVRLGFEVDDMFIGLGNVVGLGEGVLYLELRTQGKEFRYIVAKIPGVQKDDLMRLWRDFAAAVLLATEQELQDCFAHSALGNNILLLIGALGSKGFKIPNVEERLVEVAKEAFERYKNQQTPSPVGEA